jgi:N-methylhydantoinase A/oxoprolinase/acetone carboxylase beta subunit
MVSIMRTARDLSRTTLLAALTAASDRTGSRESWTRSWFLRVRFEGQGHELDVPAALTDSADDIRDRFRELHRARVGFDLPVDVEIVSARCVVSDTPRSVALERRGPSCWTDEALVDDGGTLRATIARPCSVALPDATMLVSPGWRATSLAIGGWMMECET